MNADHREAMNLYATKLLGAEPAEWRCTGCDPDGMDMQAGAQTLRLEFPERVISGTALRKMLVKLASEARARTNPEALAPTVFRFSPVSGLKGDNPPNT
jgi:putative heme iron utilization protein